VEVVVQVDLEIQVVLVVEDVGPDGQVELEIHHQQHHHKEILVEPNLAAQVFMELVEEEVLVVLELAELRALEVQVVLEHHHLLLE
jgi:hypothetical protein